MNKKHTSSGVNSLISLYLLSPPPIKLHVVVVIVDIAVVVVSRTSCL